MFRKIIVSVFVVVALITSTLVVEAGCRGGRCGGGFFGGGRPVRSFFQNRQPVRRIVRRVVTAPVRVVRQRRAAIRAYRTVAVPSVPNQVVSQLGPVNEQVVQSEYPVYDGGPDLSNYYYQDNSYMPMSTCGPNGCN